MSTIFFARYFSPILINLYEIYYIKCKPKNPNIIYLKNLIKKCYLPSMLDKSAGYLRNYCDSENKDHEKLPFDFPESTIIKERVLWNSFVLLPLFEIKASNGEIKDSFFENQKSLNIILMKDFRIQNGIYYKIHKYYEFARSFDQGTVKKFVHRDEILIEGDLYQKTSGYFIFRNHITQQKMVYVGIFLPFEEGHSYLKSKIINSVYQPYVEDKTEYFLKNINNRDESTFKLTLNLSKLLSKMKETSLSLTNEGDEPVYYNLISSVNEETITEGTELTVTLNNQKLDVNNDLYYEIQLDYGNKNLKDMHLILTPDADDEKAKTYLEKHTEHSSTLE
ncbi:hypothetical protein CDIK_3882 [Cucumispora dikerogammari]|nr:hypothetical protein CDIK_3882 [Cucumispora dikerogammari]